jgi:WD40 repeat protein
MKPFALLALFCAVAAARAQNVPLEVPKNHGGFFQFAFSPDGTLVAGGTGAITITTGGQKSVQGAEAISWDAKSGKIRHTLGRFAATVSWVSWSADGALVAAASQEDGVLKLWDAKSGAARGTIETGGEIGKSSNGSEVLAALSPDGRTIATVAIKKSQVGKSEVRTSDTLAVWDFATRQARWQATDSQVAALAFSPDGRTLAAFAVKVDWKESAGGASGAHVDPRFIAWDATNGKELWRTPATGSPERLVFVPGSGLIAIAQRRLVPINAATGALGAEVRGTGRGSLSGVAFSTDGKRFVGSRFMGEGIEWGETATGKTTEVQEFKGDRFSKASFSRDLKLAVGELKFTPQIITLAPTPTP